jgi:hypothetical protein
VANNCKYYKKEKDWKSYYLLKVSLIWVDRIATYNNTITVKIIIKHIAIKEQVLKEQA